MPNGNTILANTSKAKKLLTQQRRVLRLRIRANTQAALFELHKLHPKKYNVVNDGGI
jgi:hypothetical protein